MGRVRFATNGDVRIAFEVRGRSGPWVVLVHGLGYDRTGWGPGADRIAQRCRVVLVDNRGIGDSDAPTGPYNARVMAADVVAVLDELGLDRASVLGASLGGMVAQELAIAVPERVDRLVLAATTPGGPQATPPTADTVRLLLAVRHLPRTEAVRRLVEHGVGSGCNGRRPAVVERVITHRLQRHQDPVAWRAQAGAGVMFRASERLGRIQAPTLVVHGAEDRIVDAANAGVLVDRIPSARGVLLPGVGHLLSWEAPARFAREVTTFLRRDERTGRAGA